MSAFLSSQVRVVGNLQVLDAGASSTSCRRGGQALEASG